MNKKVAYIVGISAMTVLLIYFIFIRKPVTTVPNEIAVLSSFDLATKVNSIINLSAAQSNLPTPQRMTMLLAQIENPVNTPYITEALNRGLVQDNNAKGLLSDSRYSFNASGLQAL